MCVGYAAQYYLDKQKEKSGGSGNQGGGSTFNNNYYERGDKSDPNMTGQTFDNNSGGGREKDRK